MWNAYLFVCLGLGLTYLALALVGDLYHGRLSLQGVSEKSRAFNKDTWLEAAVLSLPGINLLTVPLAMAYAAGWCYHRYQSWKISV